MEFCSRELLSACVRVRACVFVCACHRCMRYTRSLIPNLKTPTPTSVYMPSWPLRSMRDRRSRLVQKLLGLQTENDGVLERIQAAHGEEASQQNPRPGGAATTSGATAHRRSRAHVCSADAPPGPTPPYCSSTDPPASASCGGDFVLHRWQWSSWWRRTRRER